MPLATETPVLVKNESDGPVVFTSAENPRLTYTWQGKGDPMGKDVQWVPAALAVTDPQFLAALNRGTLVVTQADEEVRQIITKQVIAYHHQRGASDEAARDILRHDQDNIVALGEIVDQGGGKVTLKDVPVPVTMDRRRGEPTSVTAPVG